MLSEARGMNLLTPEGDQSTDVIPQWDGLSPTRHHEVAAEGGHWSPLIRRPGRDGPKPSAPCVDEHDPE